MPLSKTQIKKKLKDHKYIPYDFDTRSVYVALDYTDYKDRPSEYDLLEALFVLDGVKRDKKKTYTSDGHLQVGTTNVIITPQSKLTDEKRLRPFLNKDKRKSIKNEIYLEQAIKQYVRDTIKPLTIVFKSRNKQIIIKNVKDAKQVGSDTKNRKKA
ncbi:MAG TPA: hypothetical protein ENK70_01115, partial [Methylophaga sp.]|nr:hypothetical protein [Methylophaga sp.]